MARPRKQTYTLKMYLEKINDGDIDNHADVQRRMAWSKEQINELIVTVLTDEYMPPIILGEEKNSQLHIADGGCRTAALNSFWKGAHKITASIENSVIPYKKKVKSEDKTISWEDAVFDIKNKTFEKLPEELKKKFHEYQVETVIHENCDSHKISQYIKRYNNHTSMNKDQKAFTYIERFAGEIRGILESRFFLDYSNFTEKDKTKGAVEWVIVETMMCIYHFEHWKKQPKAACQYLNENGTQQEFEQFRQSIHRLEKIVTEDVKFLFNRKDSFLFFTLFDTFTKLGMEDLRFVEFLRVFQRELRFSKKNERGLLFDEIDKDLNTKDKQVIFDKLEMLKAVMLDFFQISDGKIITAEELVREWVDRSVTEEDMELYEIVANDISEAVHDIDSVFLSDRNRPSFVALAAYAVRQDTEGIMKQWLTGFEREGRLLWNQRDNYFYMKKEFDKFVLDKTNKRSYNGINKTEQMFDDHIGGYVL